jgi:putative selenate reductase molybdopterin-binding subunit
LPGSKFIPYQTRQIMEIRLQLNGTWRIFQASPGDTLLSILRREGFFGVKFGGCQKGECGACAVLLDGKTVNSCSLLAVQADGSQVETIEALGERAQSGWKKGRGLHPIQAAFVESGAIQCGYCTPAMVLAARELLAAQPDPSEAEIRDALSGVLCRCTGYQKPVQAIRRAAARMRGEDLSWLDLTQERFNDEAEELHGCVEIVLDEEETEKYAGLLPPIWTTKKPKTTASVGHPEIKVDAVKLALGKPVFTDDVEPRGLLIAKVLRSPHPHAKIRKIDASKARSLAGVASVLTWEDIPRVVYSTAGQSDPIPGPLDDFSLDQKVRFVGDRVAFVAAETAQLAQQALELIEVEYELLPAVLDPAAAMKDGVPQIHDEPEYVNFSHSDPSKNLAAQIRIDIGDVEAGFAEADLIVEGEYEVPRVQMAHIEPHIVVTSWDEDDRLVIRTSTQVPFHVRRQIAPLLDLPIRRIRVVKPRVGGGFGGKQEVLIEDVAAHLTLATGRPVRYEYSREEEFTAARTRHPMRIRMRTGVKQDGTITANEMICLSDTGAYGCHALTVTGNTGHKPMALYVGDGAYREAPNIRYYADVVYTNHPPGGAYRGYGVPQGFWAVERQMEKIARKLGLDPLEFRLKNALRAGELQPFSRVWSEGRAARPEIIQTVGLERCVLQGKEAIGWESKFNQPEWHTVPDRPHLRRGIGAALVMHGTGVPNLDMGGASIKINDDGSFNLLVGATDLGTGSDTVLAQMAAEILGVPVADVLITSSDTDFTPFDKGAYASSTTYISGASVAKAAEMAAERIRHRAADLINKQAEGSHVSPEELSLSNRKAIAPDGRFITLEHIALDALHYQNQEQIMGIGSHSSPVAPPPFAAQFAEVTVDVQTGKITVERLVMSVDAGVVINPITAAGQVEGGMTQALGYAVCEEMLYDSEGQPRERDLVDYHIFRSDEMPQLEAMFVETYEPSHPFGAKAVAEIPIDGVAPAVANAIRDACGVEMDTIPVTPERLWVALRGSLESG